MSTHYVATIKVEKVERTENRDHGSALKGQVKRDIVEVTHLTIKSSSLDGLQEKVAAHINLLDEEDLNV